MPFYRFTLTDPYHVEVCSLLRLWLKKTVKSSRHNRDIFSSCLSVNSLSHTLVWLPKPTVEKKKKDNFCVFVFKGIRLLPSVLFFLPWTRVYNSSWLLNRWSRWNVQEIHSRASCLNHVAEAWCLCLPSPALTGSTFHVSWKHSILKKKPNNNKGKKKKSNTWTSPCPSKIDYLIPPLK